MGDLLQMPSDDFMSALSFNMFEDRFAEWERKLEQIRRKHNLLEPDRKFGMPGPNPGSLFDSPSYRSLLGNSAGKLLSPSLVQAPGRWSLAAVDLHGWAEASPLVLVSPTP